MSLFTHDSFPRIQKSIYSLHSFLSCEQKQSHTILSLPNWNISLKEIIEDKLTTKAFLHNHPPPPSVAGSTHFIITQLLTKTQVYSSTQPTRIRCKYPSNIQIKIQWKQSWLSVESFCWHDHHRTKQIYQNTICITDNASSYTIFIQHLNSKNDSSKVKVLSKQYNSISKK